MPGSAVLSSLVLLPPIPSILLYYLPLAFLVYHLILLPLYRLTFHPLSGIPGPLLSRLSSWPLAFSTTTGRRHLTLLDYHNRYGSVVRFSPSHVSVNTVSALKVIYAHDRDRGIGAEYPVQKSKWYRIIDAASGDFSTHSEVDRVRHAWRRRVLDQAFSARALREAEDHFILRHVGQWCRYLKNGGHAEAEEGRGKGGKGGKGHNGAGAGAGDGDGSDAEEDGWSSPVNMSTWSTYLNYDILGDLAFGKSFDCIRSDTNRYVPRLLMASTTTIYILGYLPFVHWIKWLLEPPIVNYLGFLVSPDGMRYMIYANDQMGERLAMEEKGNGKVEKEVEVEDEKVVGGAKRETVPRVQRRDFVHYLSTACDPVTGKGFTRAQLDADSSLLIAAGTDTTSTTLSAVFHYLLHSPSTMRKLSAELNSVFSSADEIRSGSKLNSCVYLRAVIDESLRLSPPVPTHLPREVTAPGITIDGIFYPPGTVVGTSAYAIHRNPEYYPFPHSFRPERWIPLAEDDIVDTPQEDDDQQLRSREQVKLAREAFCPFSLGSRGCVGRNLAYMELEVAIGRCLWELEIKQPDDGESKKKVAVPGGWKNGSGFVSYQDEYPIVEHFLVERDGPFVQFRKRRRTEKTSD